MKINVCDGCGEQYRPYAYTKKNGEGNTATIIKVEKDGTIRPRARLELCQKCMDDLWDFIKIDLVRPESPIHEKINRPFVYNEKKDISENDNAVNTSEEEG